jgi:transcriptional regulator with XRE-family HTH domain
MATLGERLKLLRQGMTQRAFAAKLGIPQTTLSNYEKNKCELNLALAEQITTMFGITTDWLLFERGPMRSPFNNDKQNKQTINNIDTQNVVPTVLQATSKIAQPAGIPLQKNYTAEGEKPLPSQNAPEQAHNSSSLQAEERPAPVVRHKSYQTHQDFPALRCMEPLPTYKY